MEVRGGRSPALLPVAIRTNGGTPFPLGLHIRVMESLSKDGSYTGE